MPNTECSDTSHKTLGCTYVPDIYRWSMPVTAPSWKRMYLLFDGTCLIDKITNAFRAEIHSQRIQKVELYSVVINAIESYNLIPKIIF